MPPIVRVFVSGDQKELKEERRSAIIAVGNIQLQPIAWETTQAETKTPEKWYEDQIRACHVYVGVFGLEYSEPSCKEFLLASELKLHRLAFVKLRAIDEVQNPRLQEFIRNELRPRVKYEPYFTPADLQIRIERSLAALAPRAFQIPIQHKSGLSVLDQSLIETVETRRVLFSREMQVLFEDQFSHWSVYNALKKLVAERRIQTNLEWKQRWYFPISTSWALVKEEARGKSLIVSRYARHDNRFDSNGVHYDDYSEFLVEEAFAKAGFRVEARNARQFHGKTATVLKTTRPGRPPDLDLILSLGNEAIGVQVKNRLDYPEAAGIRHFLTLCDQLGIKPVFVVRKAPESALKQITDQDGRAIVFKRWLLRPPFPRQVFEKMLEMGLPPSVYQRVPDFLIHRAEEIRLWLEQAQAE